MDLAGILDGDNVLVDRSLSPSSGDIVLAVLAGGEHTIKRLTVRNGVPELHPESSNPENKPLVAEGGELSLWGVVSAVVRRMR
ncbi:peptidase S24-like protein [Sinimarinibacterium flocculans]|uniref:Peptidase S24-like protein n=2 Tax=Sinimarinibacterium flocculans TaxID=985250 RepID=A0A318E5Y6_9GAMM|nr:peptidase S24-like protein [Sinimarinibacterium flocculans]